METKESVFAHPHQWIQHEDAQGVPTGWLAEVQEALLKCFRVQTGRCT